MLRSPQDSNKQQEIIPVKNSSLQRPNEMNSAAKISHNNKKRVKKDEKNKKKNKKKRSSLAFWFCMGSKTETADKDRQPFPAKKDKNNKKDKENVDQKSLKETKKAKSSSDEKKKSAGFSKNKEFEDKRRKRFSAPPTDWITMMATIEGQNEGNNDNGTTSGENLNLDPVSESNPMEERSRSKSPGGVRYRFDGTLEKPYVYPGGLTFLSMRQPKKNKGKRWNKRSSKKKGSNDSVIEAEIHHTDDDEEGGVCYYDSDDNYDESDIRRQFYLRYDSHMKTKSSKRDRRYSMPAELQKRVEMETDVIGAMYGRGTSRWVEEGEDPRGRRELPNVGRQRSGQAAIAVDSGIDREGRGEEEAYDEPYEGSDNEANAGHLMAHSRPSSYYQSPPPLQNSECVYMWHSCEDIPRCKEEYHSEEEIRSSRECMPRTDNDDDDYDDDDDDGGGGGGQSNRNVDDSSSTLHIRDMNVYDKSPTDCLNRGENTNPASNNITSNEAIKEVSHSSPLPPVNSQLPYRNAAPIPNPYHQGASSTNHDLSDDVFSNSFDNGNPIPSQAAQSPANINLKDHFVKNTTKPFDNPFRRNLGRASCMPGNKRFFLPPPPTYTPPREEFEIALGKIAKEEIDEEKEESKSDKDRHSRGSQTDLTDESNEEELLDMVDREKTCSHDKQKEHVSGQTLTQGRLESQEPRKSTDSSLRDDAGISILSKSDQHADNTASLDSDEEAVHDYINCPKFESPFPLTHSTPAQPNRDAPRRHTVMTSTPKSKRKSDLSIAIPNADAVTKRTPKRPVPTPRQRFSSCLEYSTVTLSSPSQSSSSSQHQHQHQHQHQQHQHPQQQNQVNTPGKAAIRNSISLPMSATPSGKPVAKKRLSQMPSSDSSYGHADIEEVLNIAKDPHYSPSTSTKHTTVRNTLFSKDDEHKSHVSVSHANSTSKKPSRILEDPNEHDNKLREDENSNDSCRDNDITNRDNSISNSTTKTRAAKILDSDTILPPLQQFRLARSPTAGRRHLGSALSSSVECLTSPLAKSSYYYSGLSSSMADIPSLFEHAQRKPGARRMLSQFPYDDGDDDDDENADDEMSVHNEESPLPRTPSLEDLLRARSILDRSQAVCRKRRQRLRDRKCRSQIISSTEVDDYMTRQQPGVRRRHSRHSSKKKDFTSSGPNANGSNSNPSTAIKPVASSTENTNAFSFDHEMTVSIPIQSRRFLYRQNRLLNHTDSGMDSDGASPFNSRDFHVPAREGCASPNQHGVAPLGLDIATDGKVNGRTGVLERSSPNTKSWKEGDRMYDGYRLKKTRSKEFLAHSSNSRHLDKNVSVSNGFETLV